MPIFCFHFFEKVEQKLVLGKRKQFKQHYPAYTVKNLWAAANFCDLVRKNNVVFTSKQKFKGRYCLTISLEDEFFTLAHRGRGFV